MAEPPPSRAALQRTLAANAATKPFNVIVPAAAAIGGLVLGAPATLMVVLAALIWIVASAVTFFDEDEAKAVGDRLRAGRRSAGAGALSAAAAVRLEDLSPAIAERLRTVRRQHGLITQAVGESELPFDEVSQEASGFVEAAANAARRAQLLDDLLTDNDARGLAKRINELQGSLSRTRGEDELLAALRVQATALDRARVKLKDFDVQMERIGVELANIRANLLAVSAASAGDEQARLAGDVRDLRERMSAVAEGMEEVLAQSPEV